MAPGFWGRMKWPKNTGEAKSDEPHGELLAPRAYKWICHRDKDWRRLYAEKVETHLCCVYAHPNETPCPKAYPKPDGLCFLGDDPEFPLSDSSAYAEVSISRSKKNTLSGVFWTIPVNGHPCTGVVFYDVNFEQPFLRTLRNSWGGNFPHLLVSEFMRQGFEDNVIVNVHNMMHEVTWDLLEKSRGLTDAGDAPPDDFENHQVENLAPAFKVVILASWNGRVKVAHHESHELVMVGHDGHELGPPVHHRVLRYNKPQGDPSLQITIREGHYCEKDVFVMVSGALQAETLRKAVTKHVDVNAIAKKLRKEVAWVARLKNA